jgi:hypothetical protein
MAAPTFRSDLDSESVSLAVLDGASLIGDSIGITTTQCITTAGTTPGATRFTAGAIFTEEQAGAAALPATAAGFITARAGPTGLSTETPGLLEGTLNRAVRAGSAQAPSAATAMAGRRGATRHAEAPATVAEDFAAEGDLAAVAGVGDRSFVM